MLAREGVQVAKAELTGIGPWRLGEVLGSGERAVVYRGISASSIASETREMAVKVLHGVLAHDADLVAEFLARAEAHERLTRLEHPRIVPSVGVDSAGKRPFTVLELIDGVSLDRLFPQRGRAKFSLAAATNVLIAVLDALSAAANEKIVHGRLSADDIIVQADGAVVLTSFGQSGDGRVDFLAIHRLAGEMGTEWPPEVEAWLQELVVETPRWRDVREARSAFPLAFDAAGDKALARAVKSRRRKDDRAREAARRAAEETPADDPSDPPVEPSRVVDLDERRREAELALKQARVVALSALAIILIALVVAVFSAS